LASLQTEVPAQLSSTVAHRRAISRLNDKLSSLRAKAGRLARRPT
jgi:hypothetical protein